MIEAAQSGSILRKLHCDFLKLNDPVMDRTVARRTKPPYTLLE